MNNGIITGSLIDIVSFAAEAAILFWFFSNMPERREVQDRRAAKVAGFLPLLVLLAFYMTPLNAAVSVFSIENLAIQVVRMLLHLLPVMCWLLMNKECTPKVAAYLAVIFTAIYLTSQNLRMIMMTYGMVTPPHEARGSGYLIGLAIVAVTELILAAVTRRLIRPEKIDTIDRQRIMLLQSTVPR